MLTHLELRELKATVTIAPTGMISVRPTERSSRAYMHAYPPARNVILYTSDSDQQQSPAADK